MKSFLFVSQLLLWLLVLFNLSLTLMLVRKHQQSTTGSNLGNHNQGPPIGLKAPPFVAENLAGETVSLMTFTGQQTVLIAIGPGCSFCINSLNVYHELGLAAKKKGVNFYLVSDTEKDITQKFCTDYNITLPMLMAPISTNPFLKDYNFQSVPGYCLIDTNGYIAFSGYPNSDLDSGWKKLAESWRSH